MLDRDGRPLPAYVPQLDRDGIGAARPAAHLGRRDRAGRRARGDAGAERRLAERALLHRARLHARRPASRLTTSTVTRDLWHRFFEHQMQIDGGKNDGYAAWSDAGGLAMGHYDYSRSALYALAQEFVLADNFFQGAFGGSFLNHQYLICACAPEYPNADTAAAQTVHRDARAGRGRTLPAAAQDWRNDAKALGAG